MLALTKNLIVAALIMTSMAGTIKAQDNESVFTIHNDNRLGHLLADAAGRTLYFYTEDQGCRSSCIGQCEKQWPPLLFDQDHLPVPGHIPGQFSIAVRSNGNRQICYNGRPLYSSRRDRFPGDVQGHGQDGKWHVANTEPTTLLLTDAEGRPYLAGPDGMTLYSMVSDRPGIGKCREGCAKNWPPLVIGHKPVAPAGLTGELGVVQRTPPDLRLQVIHEGRPLYYWSRDRIRGDTRGDGIGDIWSVARPRGADRQK